MKRRNCSNNYPPTSVADRVGVARWRCGFGVGLGCSCACGRGYRVELGFFAADMYVQSLFKASSPWGRTGSFSYICTEPLESP